MRVPRRIHISSHIVRKLPRLDPRSAFGKYDWVLRGKYYYRRNKDEVATR